MAQSAVSQQPENLSVRRLLHLRSAQARPLLPAQGVNVLDILRRQKLVLTKAALSAIEERFK